MNLLFNNCSLILKGLGVVQIPQIVKKCYEVQLRSIISWWLWNQSCTSWHIDHIGSTIALTNIFKYFWNQIFKIPSKFDFRLGFSDFDKIFVVMSSKYGSFWGETYLHLLNNGIFVVRSFENLHYTNLSKLMQESIEILMNETSESFYPLDMFEFIHHPQYGCHDH
jgi:hypothetical protein